VGYQGDPRSPLPPLAAQIKHLPTPTALRTQPHCLHLPNTTFVCVQRPVALHHHSPAWMHSQTYPVICNKEMRVQEQELQRVPEGVGQTELGCAPRGTHSLSLIFQVFQINTQFSTLCNLQFCFRPMCKLLITLEECYLHCHGI